MTTADTTHPNGTEPTSAPRGPRLRLVRATVQLDVAMDVAGKLIPVPSAPIVVDEDGLLGFDLEAVLAEFREQLG